ncbi:DUF222 domain-containing protein [Corynebacterium poyangense]|uniref:DUF222 domain-containing protein n=1 Tax=Corynebacterium poyangense TaxID=2684405 RepID=A0A7H0SLB1_9CORY|nr:HNH endonuclease signature motif containing protein [Corynebacterium poyangense]QNQ89336.1 DUF222 domain-containing protein [Corynebacterium poyangense]
MSEKSDIKECVETLRSCLDQIFHVFSPPTSEAFQRNAEDIRVLEHILNFKADVDNAITKSAILAEAGDRVGSRTVIDYFVEELGLSRRTAQRRIDNALLAYPDHNGQPDEPSPTDQQSPKETQPPRPQPSRASTNDEGKKRHRISEEKQSIIASELRHLSKAAQDCRQEIYHDAMKEARLRAPQDLQRWVRRRVELANQKVDHNHAHRDTERRFLMIHDPDHDGGARISGYLPRAQLALLQALIAPAKNLGHLLPESEAAKDSRTISQRRFDALFYILQHKASARDSSRGVGSVIISLTASDIVHLSQGQGMTEQRFPTNTNVVLTGLDLLKLGQHRYHYIVLHDEDTGNPLYLGRTSRLANLYQRIALFARDLVCQHPGCDQAFAHCQAHHLQPWNKGGETGYLQSHYCLPSSPPKQQ